MQPHITEFYGVRVDENWDVVSEFETFVKPPIPIPEIVTKITGITDQMVAGAPKFIEIFDGLVEFFIGARTMVAHNLPFDSGVLLNELIRHGLEHHFPWPPTWHCTVEISRPIKNKSIKLGVLHEIATGRPHVEDAHRAKSDVMALVRSYKWLVEQGFVK